METTIGIGKKNDKQETMDSAAYLNPAIIINTKFGNVKDSYLLDWCNDGKFDADPKIEDD